MLIELWHESPRPAKGVSGVFPKHGRKFVPIAIFGNTSLLAIMKACIQPNLIATYLHHYNELRQFSSRKVNCNETANDLVQEIYLCIAQHQTETDILNQRAFLFEEFVGTHPQPEHALMGMQALERVKQSLEDLPPRSRTVFLLCQLHGKSHRQMSKKLGITLRTVELLMHQALKLLKNHNAFELQD